MLFLYVLKKNIFCGIICAPMGVGWMKNYEIVNAVFSRDKTGNLINLINTYGRMRNQGCRNFLGYDRVRDLYEVISKLNDCKKLSTY